LAFSAFGIEPSHNSPSENSTSVPEIRGEPSLRSVAIVLCLCASKLFFTRSASSGAAAENSVQVAMDAKVASRAGAVQ
jgi:hypothetical protein